MNTSELPITSGLINGHHDLLKKFSDLISIEGKNCLCLGYDEQQLKELVIKYNPKKVTLLTLWADHKDSNMENYEVVVGDISKKTSFNGNEFDFVITFSVLEHIKELENAFIEIQRVLKPGGYFASLFGPAWSCHVGHHFYAKPGDPLFDFCQWNMPSHMHLLSSSDEIKTYYQSQGATDKDCKSVQQWFFETDIMVKGVSVN